MGKAENTLQRACLEYLELRQITAWRNNTGVLRNPRGRPVRYGVVGSGDIFAVLPDGRFASIECKVNNNKPSAEQLDWRAAIQAAGGIAIVARTVDDVEDMLREHVK